MAVLVRETHDVVLAASLKPLPGVGANLTMRQSLLLRWAASDIARTTGAAPAVQSSSGQRFTLTAEGKGLWCVALVTYRRMGLTDPLEVRPSLPPGVEIDYLAYERMMNIMANACPAAVEINTWRIRQRHVRLDPKAPLAALNLSAARSFRRWRQPRFATPLAATPSGDSDG
jgi:hypothetical protein